MRWSIENARLDWIVAPTFDSSANEVAVDELALRHEGR